MGLSESLEAELTALAAAQEASPDHTFMVSITMGGPAGARLTHPGIKATGHEGRLPVPVLESLDEAGMISLSWDGNGQRGRFRLTDKGRLHATRARRRELDHAELGPDGLDWETAVRPVLQALYDAYVRSPSPWGVEQAAVNAELDRAAEDPITDRILYTLEQNGYLHAEMGADDRWGPTVAKPTEKALQHVARWPSGPRGDVVTKLLVALDERIADDATPDDEKSKLRQLREQVGIIGRDVLVEVLAKVATGGMP